MSGSSLFAENKPIRGGVPICFPWFGPREGDPKSPAHGFARLTDWSVVKTEPNLVALECAAMTKPESGGRRNLC